MSLSPPRIDTSGLPVYLDANGIRKMVAPVGKSLLYELSNAGEIRSTSAGMKKGGRRLFVVQSVVDWLERRSRQPDRTEPQTNPMQEPSRN